MFRYEYSHHDSLALDARMDYYAVEIDRLHGIDFICKSMVHPSHRLKNLQAPRHAAPFLVFEHRRQRVGAGLLYLWKK